MEKADKTNYIAQSLTGILDIIICLLLFISSIYKGAFYKSDFLFPNVIISVVGVIYLIYKIVKEIINKEKDSKPRSKVRVLLDMCMLILPFTYTFPILFKTYVSLPDSVFEMLRYVNMTIIYFIARSTKNENIYMNIFVLISIVQSILGIDQLTFRNFEEFLNDLSTGYLPDTERLSATLQYANVTGIVILFGTIICFSNISRILEKKSKSRYLEMLICIFFILLQITAIVLTKSRIATLACVIVLLADSLFNMKHINKNMGIYKFILIIYAIFVSSVIENNIIDNKFSIIYIALFVFSLIVVIIGILFKLTKVFFEKRINIGKIQKTINILNKRSVKNITVLVLISIFCIVLFVSKDLKIINNANEVVVVERSIYDFKEGKNAFKIETKTLQEETKYVIEIYGINDGYEMYQVAVFSNENKFENIFKAEVDLNNDIRKLMVYIKVQNGSLEIEKFTINKKNITLSYMFMPDNIMFKIKDTFTGSYSDSLRLEYVKDSFKLLKQSPIIGIGGEGFKHTYGMVQESGYISSEAHSAIMQAFVEVGILGTSILIAIVCLLFVIIIKLVINFKIVDIEDKKHTFKLISMCFGLLWITMFDLAFSYAFIIYLFGVILALIIKAYIDVLHKYKQGGKQSKVDWSYIKIIVLSLSVVCLSVTTYFSINAFRASLIKVPNKNENLNILEVAENIAYLELKVKQDRFDMDYIRELNEEYAKYKSLVMQGYVNSSNDNKTREELNTQLNSVTQKIKENADRMLQYEYYDKYVLNDVADVYIDNYINFAQTYKKQFESDEIAYAFCLNYVLKLTDRIKELNPHSTKANEIYVNMCNKYVEKLERDNRYLQSDTVQNVIKQLKERI